MSELSRLSDQNITDDLLRAEFYRIVLSYMGTAGREVTTYTIKLDETYRPDLASYRAFGTKDLDWLICLICELVDPADELPVGEDIELPSAAWVRRAMRQFMDDMGL